jgi:hypothetical protein
MPNPKETGVKITVKAWNGNPQGTELYDLDYATMKQLVNRGKAEYCEREVTDEMLADRKQFIEDAAKADSAAAAAAAAKNAVAAPAPAEAPITEEPAETVEIPAATEEVATPEETTEEAVDSAANNRRRNNR